MEIGCVAAHAPALRLASMNGHASNASRHAGTQLPFDGPDLHATASAQRRIQRYILLRQIGQGGMGTVHEAWDPELGRRVAIKILDIQDDTIQLAGESARPFEQFESQFIAETKTLAKLSHPNIVPIYDVGRCDNELGKLFLATEMIDGQSLREIAQARSRGHDSRSWKDIVDLFLRVGEGLVYAHRQGIVHRDIKPDNLILGVDGDVRILDFGIAYDRRREASRPKHAKSPRSNEPSKHSFGAESTQAEIIGTILYMSPEQLRGEPVDERSDQYSFCISLYELLTGRRPFRATSLAARAVEAETPPRFQRSQHRGLPRRILRILETGLHPEATHRYGSMHGLLSDLQQARDASPIRSYFWAPFLFAAAFAIHSASPSHASATQRCKANAERVQSLWTSEDKKSLEAKFESIGGKNAGHVALRISSALTDYQEQLRAAIHESCEDQFQAQATQRDRVFQCLQARTSQLQTLTRLLLQANERTVAQGSAIVERMVDPAGCLKASSQLQATANFPPDIDPIAGKALLERIEELDIYTQTGQFEAGIAYARSIYPEAQLLDEDFFGAWIDWHLSNIYYNLGDINKTNDTLRSAIRRAMRSHNELASAYAKILYAFTQGYLQADIEDSPVELQREALAATLRNGASEDLLALYELRTAPFTQTQNEGRLRSSLEHATAYFEHQYGPRHLLTITSNHDLAYVVGRQGDYIRAIDILEQVLEDSKSDSNQAHPVHIYSIQSLSQNYAILGYASKFRVLAQRGHQLSKHSDIDPSLVGYLTQLYLYSAVSLRELDTAKYMFELLKSLAAFDDGRAADFDTLNIVQHWIDIEEGRIANVSMDWISNRLRDIQRPHIDIEMESYAAKLAVLARLAAMSGYMKLAIEILNHHPSDAFGLQLPGSFDPKILESHFYLQQGDPQIALTIANDALLRLRSIPGITEGALARIHWTRALAHLELRHEKAAYESASQAYEAFSQYFGREHIWTLQSAVLTLKLALDSQRGDHKADDIFLTYSDLETPSQHTASSLELALLADIRASFLFERATSLADRTYARSQQRLARQSYRQSSRPDDGAYQRFEAWWQTHPNSTSESEALEMTRPLQQHK